MPVSVRLIRFSVAVLVALLACAIAKPGISSAQGQRSGTHLATEAQFQDWLRQTVWPDAHKQGVSRETFERNLSAMRLDWDLPELQPPGRTAPSDDQRQAEFQHPGRYFAEAQLASLAKRGGELLRQWNAVLDDIERRYGVPREIVVAIWGRESHFGRVAARHQALRVLATQAFMGRRRALYYPELLAALVILEEDHFSGETLLSSWAGAMGQPQLLPSKFLRYAVDADADGRRDVWHSVPDSLASIANYLREHGWKPDSRWGLEVSLPQAVSCTLEGPRRGRSVQEWLRLGLTPSSGDAWPAWNGNTTAFLVMPAGRLGPSFLVSENFYVLKQYNESDLYALFIGHLADRMSGASAFAGQWRPTDAMKRSDLQAMQERLKGHGYDVGKVDGLVGFATRTAIGQWQAKSRLDQTCFPETALIQAIRGANP
ncbi:lytic murein transglycosylase [Microvirga sp. VF16]|uniref:lytic murein transglycosylase n=1 Tax=Microvirga sp. VF16 TaxID=2807101 RepID=UPI00193EACFE|nr:lytic murein transglycosylase [Microvirga sp. VF16]QRM29209.1 lytic murein transglycosylase [Microvirga sp. VF16]